MMWEETMFWVCITTMLRLQFARSWRHWQGTLHRRQSILMLYKCWLAERKKHGWMNGILNEFIVQDSHNAIKNWMDQRGYFSQQLCLWCGRQMEMSKSNLTILTTLLLVAGLKKNYSKSHRFLLKEYSTQAGTYFCRYWNCTYKKNAIATISLLES